jgi:hypothetical protein
MSDWTLLARGGVETSVSRCPEGHIHLEYGVTNLKLDDRRFLELADVVCAAARRLGWPTDACGREGEAAEGRSGMN